MTPAASSPPPLTPTPAPPPAPVQPNAPEPIISPERLGSPSGSTHASGAVGVGATETGNGREHVETHPVTHHNASNCNINSLLNYGEFGYLHDMPPPVGHSTALDAYLEYTPRTLPVMTDEHDGITLERIPFEWPELIPPFDWDFLFWRNVLRHANALSKFTQYGARTMYAFHLPSVSDMSYALRTAAVCYLHYRCHHGDDAHDASSYHMRAIISRS